MIGKLLFGLSAFVALNAALAYDLSDCQVDFCQTMVAQHNYYRAKHHADDLTIDDDLSKSAQQYAEYLASRNNGLVHSKGDYGENLAYQMDSRLKMNQATCKKLGVSMTDMWYNELYNPGYTYGDDFSSGIGHFTQVVWANSKRIGCGIGVGSSGNKFYGVAQYNPPGNYEGEFSENVLEP